MQELEVEYRQALKALTNKQRTWVEAFDGNATEAARVAGYAHPRRAGHRLSTNVHISQIVDMKRRLAVQRNEAQGVAVMDADALKLWWSNLIRGAVTCGNKAATIGQRLHAADSLARSLGMFAQQLDVTVNAAAEMSREERQRRLKELGHLTMAYRGEDGEHAG